MLFAEEQVCATFDSLVARQIIYHGPVTLVYFTDKSFRVSSDRLPEPILYYGKLNIKVRISHLSSIGI
jgi:hypothetical protein